MNDWQPIASAPKDIRVWVIQMTPGDYEKMQCGGKFREESGEHWCVDVYDPNVKRRTQWETAFWECDLPGLLPTHWRHMPLPPEAG